MTIRRVIPTCETAVAGRLTGYLCVPSLRVTWLPYHVRVNVLALLAPATSRPPAGSPGHPPVPRFSVARRGSLHERLVGGIGRVRRFGRRGEDRHGPSERAGGIDAALAVTSRSELEALLLDEPGADRDDLGIELDPGVRADLTERRLHTERSAVGTV